MRRIRGILGVTSFFIYLLLYYSTGTVCEFDTRLRVEKSVLILVIHTTPSHKFKFMAAVALSAASRGVIGESVTTLQCRGRRRRWRWWLTGWMGGTWSLTSVRVAMGKRPAGSVMYE